MASDSCDRVTKRMYKKLSKRLLKEVGDRLEERLLAPQLDVINEQTMREFTEARFGRVKLLAIGPPEAVMEAIHTLHNLGFAEATMWSIPLEFGKGKIELQLSPGEIARILAWRKQLLSQERSN